MYYPDWNIRDLTDTEILNTFVFYDGDSKTVGAINYDLVFRRPTLAKLEHFTLMLDESSLIQNETAKRSKFILNKLHPDNVILLSGTPTGGKYEYLWSQLHLLGWKISKELYWKQYINVRYDTRQGFPIKIVEGYKNVERLKTKMREHGCRFLKTDEVFDLPSQVYDTIYVPVTKEYRRFHRDSIVTVDGTELVGDTILTQMLYERMLCGQYNADKLDALSDLIQSTSDRLIIFYNFDAELNQIVRLCSELSRPISIINGKVKDLQAYDTLDDSITLIQYQAGSMGLNLQKANRIIYFTPTLLSELYEQSQKRTHRIGQERTCFYYRLVCRNSIEERIYSTLAERRDYTNDLFKAEHDDP
jgi:SNF2 family DNA or RNA helicase